MALKLANNATARLAVSLSNVNTSVILQAGDGAKFPALGPGDWFPITVLRADDAREVMYVTARVGDTLTVERGQENTMPLAFIVNDRVELRATAGVFNRIMSAIGMIGPRIGDIRPWHGDIDDIEAVHGPGWQLADGTNGTVDLRDKFVVAAGGAYNPGDTGGANTVTLTAAQMPQHNHGVTDPGHSHGISDPGHVHAVSDPGHTHGHNAAVLTPSSTGGGAFQINGYGGATINAAVTGISVLNHATGISVNGAGTGISTQNAGNGAAHENRPPYFALAFIEYTGIGVVSPLTLGA